MTMDVQDVIEPTDANLRSARATEPLIRWLIAAAKEWTTVTYGEAGRRLEEEHGFGRIFPWRMRVAADAAMDEILSVDGSAPLLVSLLVNKEEKLPGKGFERKYLRHRFDEWDDDAQKRAVEQAMEEVYAWQHWGGLYKRFCESKYAELGRPRSACDGESRNPCAPGFRDPFIPNDETVKVIEAARRGALVVVGDVGGLMTRLNAED